MSGFNISTTGTHLCKNVWVENFRLYNGIVKTNTAESFANKVNMKIVVARKTNLNVDVLKP